MELRRTTAFIRPPCGSAMSDANSFTDRGRRAPWPRRSGPGPSIRRSDPVRSETSCPSIVGGMNPSMGRAPGILGRAREHPGRADGFSGARPSGSVGHRCGGVGVASRPGAAPACRRRDVSGWPAIRVQRGAVSALSRTRGNVLRSPRLYPAGGACRLGASTTTLEPRRSFIPSARKTRSQPWTSGNQANLARANPVQFVDTTIHSLLQCLNLAQNQHSRRISPTFVEFGMQP